MSDVVRYLTSLAQALARMSLYAAGHPARDRAADISFEMLRALQRSDPCPMFSFIGGDVVYANRPMRDLQGWDWARKLSSAGVQRMEFAANVDREEYRAFLEGVLKRLGVRTASERREGGQTPVGGTERIRFGAVGVRGSDQGADGSDGAVSRESFDLSEEAETVQWVHEEVAARNELPLAEAETVVHALANAMHAGQRVLLPLLSLKEFDQYTTTHALNVSVLSMALAEHLGLSSREVHMYGMTGLLHDLGKVKVPLEVLRKPGALNAEEVAHIQRHPVDGARLILEHDPRLDLCAVVAFEHHIMIDGGGYPSRQRRCDCHHASMLVHVCDVFDALRTNRPYRVAWETRDILEYIEKRVGTEFEPTISAAFLSMMDTYELQAAHAEVIDGEFAPGVA
ncbi:MAG: HD domain-containing protein [Cytophagaceae bacterium]|nr:HD domain-containing protein [Gemmatimonadaceae bacterium]